LAEVFVSYRSDDEPYAAAEIYAVLARLLGEHQVFRDCDSVTAGTHYPPAIRQALDRCDAMVVVIGPRWLRATKAAGGRRLDEPEDWIRFELRNAFARGIPILPVLLDRVAPLPAKELPEDIRQLAYLQTIRVRHQFLSTDLGELVDALIALVPRLRGDPPPPSGAPERDPVNVWNQQNAPAEGGIVYANQGSGNQIVEAGLRRDARRRDA
jgi:hypothetical protein